MRTLITTDYKGIFICFHDFIFYDYYKVINFKSGAKVLHFFEIGKRLDDFSVFLRHGDIAGTNKYNRIMNIKRRSKSPAGKQLSAVAAAKLP